MTDTAEIDQGQRPGFPVKRLVGHWGRGDLMAIAAFRYCCGRQTYIVSDCADWLLQHWHNLTPNARAVIQRDLEAEFERDDEARLDGKDYKPLGADCDRASWEKVRTLWQPNAKGQPTP